MYEEEQVSKAKLQQDMDQLKSLYDNKLAQVSEQGGNRIQSMLSSLTFSFSVVLSWSLTSTMSCLLSFNVLFDIVDVIDIDIIIDDYDTIINHVIVLIIVTA